MYPIILSRYQELEKQIHDIQKQLSAMPEGHLCCTNNGKYHKWYPVKNHIYTYIPKNLIITYETSKHPLDLYTIEKILLVYFL